MRERRYGTVRVYRRRNERFAPNCVGEVDNYGGGNVMVWGAISYARKRQFVPIQGNLNAARYRDEILIPHLLPSIDVQWEIFQQDNARPHTERLTIDYLQNQNITVIPWPSKLTDLNPIEHLRDELDRRVCQPQPESTSSIYWLNFVTCTNCLANQWWSYITSTEFDVVLMDA